MIRLEDAVVSALSPLTVRVEGETLPVARSLAGGLQVGTRVLVAVRPTQGRASELVLLGPLAVSG